VERRFTDVSSVFQGWCRWCNGWSPLHRKISFDKGLARRDATSANAVFHVSPGGPPADSKIRPAARPGGRAVADIAQQMLRQAVQFGVAGRRRGEAAEQARQQAGVRLPMGEGGLARGQAI